MKTYELLSVIKPNLDSEEVDKVVEKLNETVTGFEGTVVGTERIGRKKLAYEVSNFRDGYFVTIELQIPADKVAEFKRQLKLNDSILRFMFLESSKVKA